MAGAQSVTDSYTYDVLGRLVETRSTDAQNNIERRETVYDAAGNRQERKTTCLQGSCTSVPTPTPTPTSPPAVAMVINDSSGMEGSTISFVVTLSQSYSSSINVNYAVAFGTATSTDLITRTGTLTFVAGQTSRTIDVQTIQDSSYEPTENFTINLMNATAGATLSDAQGIGTILDDDDLQPLCPPGAPIERCFF
jgi:Calx-beta domain